MQKKKWTKEEALQEIAEETEKYGFPYYNEARVDACLH